MLSLDSASRFPVRIALAVSLLLLAAGFSRACDPTDPKTSPDAAVCTGSPSPSDLRATSPGVSNLDPTGECSPVNPCVPIIAGSPFTRPVGNYVFETGGCFSVARYGNEDYVLLVTVFPQEPNPGFYRTTSVDGVNWASLSASPVLAGNTYWFTGIKCPDLRYADDGTLRLYFKGSDRADGVSKFGFATSTDDGVTWSVHPTPVFASSFSGWEGAIDMPSVIDRGIDGVRRFVLAYYADPVVGDGLTGDIGIAYSEDGITWTKHPANPRITKGSDPWNCRVAGRPRLLMGPEGELHCFYAGDRVCIKVLHAVSTDGGTTWVKDPLPIYDIPDDTGSWEYGGGLYCTSFVWKPFGEHLEMFYTGPGPHVGLAEADWPLSTPTAVGEPSVPSALPLLVTPNPSSGQTTIQLASLDEGIDVAATLSLRIHDVTGRLVRLVWSGTAADARNGIVWDGRGNGAGIAPNGRYLVTLTNGETAVAAAWVTLSQ